MLCVLAIPIWFLLPVMYYVMLSHAAIYYVVHTVCAFTGFQTLLQADGFRGITIITWAKTKT